MSVPSNPTPTYFLTQSSYVKRTNRFTEDTEVAEDLPVAACPVTDHQEGETQRAAGATPAPRPDPAYKPSLTWNKCCGCELALNHKNLHYSVSY